MLTLNGGENNLDLDSTQPISPVEERLLYVVSLTAHDRSVMELENALTERMAQTCQVHMDEMDEEIRIIEHMLSDLHGIRLIVSYFDALEAD